MGQCTTFLIIWNDKKKVLCFGKVILAFGPFLVFFWPSEGLRPSSGQKNPKNGPQAKMTLPQHKFFFVLPHDDIVVHFSMKHYVTLKSSLPEIELSLSDMFQPSVWYA